LNGAALFEKRLQNHSSRLIGSCRLRRNDAVFLGAKAKITAPFGLESGLPQILGKQLLFTRLRKQPWHMNCCEHFFTGKKMP
jgi:hypothetical protein